MFDKSVLLQGEQGPPGSDSTVPGPQGPPGESIVDPQGLFGADSTVPGPQGPLEADGFGSWSKLDKPDLLDLISFYNIGPYTLPPVKTNYDLVVQNSVTPSANTTYNLWQKDLRYLSAWSDLVACSNVAFRSSGDFIGVFSGSYNELQDKPEFSQPEYYENLSFFHHKSLTLTIQSNNLIPGLNLETTGSQLSWIRADRLICTEMSVGAKRPHITSRYT